MKRQKPLPNPIRGKGREKKNHTVVFSISMILFALFAFQAFLLSQPEIEISDNGDVSRVISPFFMSVFSIPIFTMGMIVYVGAIVSLISMYMSLYNSKLNNFPAVLTFMLSLFIVLVSLIGVIQLEIQPNSGKAETALEEKGLNSSISYSAVSDFDGISVLEPMVNEFKDGNLNEGAVYDIFAVKEKGGDLSIYYASHNSFGNVDDLKFLGTAQKDDSLAVKRLLSSLN